MHLIQLQEDYLRYGISYGLSNPYKQDKIVQNWFNTEIIAKNFIDIVKEIINDASSPESLLLLKKAFTETEDGGN